MGDNRPPVRGRDRPAVPGHQPHAVRDDVEDLPVRILQDLFLVERGGGDVASLKQNPPAVAAGVVAGLAIDRVALAAALEKVPELVGGAVPRFGVSLTTADGRVRSSVLEVPETLPESLVERFGIPFRHLPVRDDTREEQERALGALSTLNASYASASEYYLMNIYGKEATAYYDLHNGLRLLKRGEGKPVAVPATKNDTFVEELEEFAAACRGDSKPEVGGDYATRSLAVVRAGIVSARKGRRVEVAEIMRYD